VSQNFGVALATSGPGATNLITAIGSCYFDSIPALFITGQVNTAHIKRSEYVRQHGFQETDIVSVVRPITKYAHRISDAKEILYQLEKAVYLAKAGRPGPALLDIPINIQMDMLDTKKLKHFRPNLALKGVAKRILRKDLIKIQDFLSKAKAPLVLVGNGVRLSQTTRQFADFVHRNHLPVVSSLLGLDAYQQRDKYFVGFIGVYGNREANIVLANADLIIALGSRLDLRQTGDPETFGLGAKIIHVDIDPYSLNYVVKSDISLCMDLKDFFTGVADLRTFKKQSWLDFIHSINQAFGRLDQYPKRRVDINTFIAELSKQAAPNAIMLADVGQNQMWAAQSWRCKKGQRMLFAGGMGAMGFALPAAVGAHYAKPSAPIVAICGDGGLQINSQELETVVRNRIPIKLFILNNRTLGMVREFQEHYLDKNYQSTVEGYGCPDLKKIAYAYGLEYRRIISIKKSDAVFGKILRNRRPMLLEVPLEPNTPLTPKIMFGHSLEDQHPYLSDSKKLLLQSLKQEFLSGRRKMVK
jgi:acetolactate synthase-1/2/3 large subunit